MKIHRIFFGLAIIPALLLILQLFLGSFSIKIFNLSIPMHYILICMLCFVLLGLLSKSSSFYQVGVLISVIWILYLGNGKTLAVGDTLPARYLPMSILKDGDFYLDEAKMLYGRRVPYFLEYVNRHYVSSYPIGAPVFATPFYVISAIGDVGIENYRFIVALEKFAASGTVVLSVVILFLAARQITSPKISFWTALIYAVCTTSFSTSSQALWQHGTSQLGFALAIYCLLRGRTDYRWIGYSGFAVSMVVLCRPQNAPLVIPIVAFVSIYHFRQMPAFLLFALPCALFQLWYNHTYFHDALRTQFPLFDASLWRTPFWEGLRGILFSPSRGLFIYSPIFLLSIPGILFVWRNHLDPLLRFLSISVIIAFILYSKFTFWWGGWSYGPRLLSDITPILSLFLIPFLEKSAEKKWRLRFVMILSVFSAFAHFNGAFIDDRKWNRQKDFDNHPEQLWLWTDNALINPYRRVLSIASIRLRKLPTNRSHPDLVKADYDIKIDPVIIGNSLKTNLKVLNTGNSVWLGWSRETDVVEFRLQWIHKDQVMHKFRKSVLLPNDVFPGESVEFPLEFKSPVNPGVYSLELGLASPSGWLPDPGTAPLRFRVRIDWIDNKKIHKIRRIQTEEFIE